MLKLREHKGITLIALIITIIILLILAGITISQLGENGLFNNTQEAKEKYNYESEHEQLEIEIANFKMQKIVDNGDITLNELKIYLESSKFDGIYEVELFYEPLATTEDVSTKPVYAKVTHLPTKFVFYVDGKLVVIGGETGAKLKPSFKAVEEGKTTIKVTMSSTGAVEYKYYISTDGTNYTLSETSASNVYTFTELIPSTKYYIKVSAKDKMNKEEENKKEITTRESILVSNVTLDTTEKGIVVDKTFTITATVGPEDAEEKGVTWSTSDSSKVSIVSSTDNTVTVKGLASTETTPVTITATSKDGSGKEFSCNIRVYETLSACMGYVTEGLMLHYDGIENTLNGHSDSATMWSDLTQNGKNGTLVGNSWGTNYLTFDGVNDYVRIGQLNYNNVTIEAVMEYTATSSDPKDLVSSFESGGYALTTWGNSSKTNYNNNAFTVYLNNGGYKYVASANQYVANKKYRLSGSYDGSTIKLWENSDKYTNNVSGTIGFPASNTYLILGANPCGTSADIWYTPMKIYSVRVYNRALTDQEIQNNYNIDNSRFNIE